MSTEYELAFKIWKECRANIIQSAIDAQIKLLREEVERLRAAIDAEIKSLRDENHVLRERLRQPNPDRDFVNKCNTLQAWKDKQYVDSRKEIGRLRDSLEKLRGDFKAVDEQRKAWWRLLNDAERMAGLSTTATVPDSTCIIDRIQELVRQAAITAADSERASALMIMEEHRWDVDHYENGWQISDAQGHIIITGHPGLVATIFAADKSVREREAEEQKSELVDQLEEQLRHNDPSAILAWNQMAAAMQRIQERRDRERIVYESKPYCYPHIPEKGRTM